jgi:hypothetical protein
MTLLQAAHCQLIMEGNGMASIAGLSLSKYKDGSEKAVQWLLKHLDEDGSYGASVQDIASYYKSPYLFYLSGRVEKAYRLLRYVKKRFM